MYFRHKYIQISYFIDDRNNFNDKMINKSYHHITQYIQCELKLHYDTYIQNWKKVHKYI